MARYKDPTNEMDDGIIIMMDRKTVMPKLPNTFIQTWNDFVQNIE